VRRRTSLILVASVATLVAIAAITAITAKAAVPPANLAKTLESQRRLAAQKPNDPAVLNDLGNLLVLSGQPAEAETAYRKAIELDATKSSALFNLGLLLQQRGSLREAEDLYGRVLKNEPGNAWAHYQLGTIEEAQKKPSRAIDSYAKAFALDPQLAFPEVNPHVLDNRLVTQAMMRAYRNDFAVPQVPKVYEDPARIAALLVPPAPANKDQTAAAPQAAAPLKATPGVRPPVPPVKGGTPGNTVLRERDLDRANTTGQAGPPGAVRGGGSAVGGMRQTPGGVMQPGALRQWNRPEPTVQEVPDDTNGGNDGTQPQPVVTPPPSGVYYRPGIQSTGQLNLLVVPEQAGRG
jgi:Tfp pilus assembly protein PilF